MECTKSSRKNISGKETRHLLKILPQNFKDCFKVTNKIGSGTFSNVFMARCNNGSEKKYALKHISTTTHPKRILRELKCLVKLKGTNNVVGLETCFHFKGHTILVLPHFEHQKFEKLVTQMTYDDIRLYMKGLLEALKHVHAHNIIHRDIKPSNFLFNRQTKQCLLVDFGLAELKQVSAPKKEESINEVERSCENFMADTGNADASVSKKLGPFVELSQNFHLDQALGPPVKKRAKGENNEQKEYCSKDVDAMARKNASQKKPHHEQKKLPCDCFGRFSVCKICLARKSAKCSRAGTSGFRAPEILLQCSHQTTAIDVWSAGVIFLSLLCRCLSFFHPSSSVDLFSLAQMCKIFGTSRMRKTARELGKHIVMSMNYEEVDLAKLVIAYRNPLVLRDVRNEDELLNLIAKTSLKELPACGVEDDETTKLPTDAIDLLSGLIEPNPRTRITAAQALQHPFLHFKA